MSGAHNRRSIDIQTASIGTGVALKIEMLRKTPPILAFTLVVSVGFVRGQAPVKPTASDLAAVCYAYEGTELLVVGRAAPPLSSHISGEAAIEAARTRDLAAAVPIVIGKATEQDGFIFAVATK